MHPLLCLDDPRGRDELLGTGDLGGGLYRPDPPSDQAKLRRKSSIASLSTVMVSSVTSPVSLIAS